MYKPNPIEGVFQNEVRLRNVNNVLYILNNNLCVCRKMVRAGYFKMPAEIQYTVPNGMEYNVQQVRTKINLNVLGT